MNALTLAARQYEIDAVHASELALHGMTIFEPAEALARQSRQYFNRCPRTTRQNHASMGARSALNIEERRRFPPPWTAEKTDAYFIVRDQNEQALAYVYCEDLGAPDGSRHAHTRRGAAHRGHLIGQLGRAAQIGDIEFFLQLGSRRNR